MNPYCQKCGVQAPDANGTYCTTCAPVVEATLGEVIRAYVRGEIRHEDAHTLREAYALVWAWEAKQKDRELQAEEDGRWFLTEADAERYRQESAGKEPAS